MSTERVTTPADTEARVDQLAGLLWGGAPGMWEFVKATYPNSAERQRELARLLLKGMAWEYRENRRGHRRRRLVTLWTGVPDDGESLPGDAARE